jgi:DNA polymerase III subunit alpha
MIQSVVKRPTRKGTMMARFEIADETGSREVVAFSRVFEEIAPLLVEDVPAVLVCEASEDGDAVRLVADRLIRWDRPRARQRARGGGAALRPRRASGEHQLEELRSRLDEHSGTTPVELRVRAPEGIVHFAVEGVRVDPGALARSATPAPGSRRGHGRRRSLTRERAAQRNGSRAQRAAAERGAATDVPF